MLVYKSKQLKSFMNIENKYDRSRLVECILEDFLKKMGRKSN
jgi:hypothetical protein